MTNANKIIITSLIAASLLAGLFYWYVYLYQAPVIFNYHSYDPPLSLDPENETADLIIAEPALHARRAPYRVNNMRDVRESYVQRDWETIGDMPETIGRGPIWGDFFRPRLLSSARQTQAVVRFEYITLKGDRLCYVLIRSNVDNHITGSFVAWENEGWKAVYDVSFLIWGKDVQKIDYTYKLESLPNDQKPLTEKGINDLVRIIRQEVLAENKDQEIPSP